MPDPTTETYIRFYDLAAVDPVTAEAAIGLQNHHDTEPLGDEAIDAARLAKARHDRLVGHNAVPLAPWDRLTDDERTTAAADALEYLRAARDAGLARTAEVPSSAAARRSPR